MIVVRCSSTPRTKDLVALHVALAFSLFEKQLESVRCTLLWFCYYVGQLLHPCGAVRERTVLFKAHAIRTYIRNTMK